jgi:hypothetical protein
VPLLCLRLSLSVNLVIDHFMSFYVISGNLGHSCLFMSFHVISCHFMSFHVISCHFMSFRVISCHIMSFHVISSVIGLLRPAFDKVGRGGQGRGGQICLPKPSATALLSGRRQKCPQCLYSLSDSGDLSLWYQIEKESVRDPDAKKNSD